MNDEKKTKQQLLDAAAEIRDEKDRGENTAERVGGLMYDMINSLDPSGLKYIYYNILPSPSTVQFNVRTQDNTLIPTSIPITCKVSKQEGKDTTIYEYDQEAGELKVDGFVLYYKLVYINGAESVDPIKYNGSITIDAESDTEDSKVVSVNLYLIEEETQQVIQQLNVPVIRNGKAGTGAPGEDAVRLDIENTFDIIPCDASGKLLEDVSIKAIASIYKGAEIQIHNGQDIKIEVSSVEDILGNQGISSTAGDGKYDIIWTIPEGTVVDKSKYSAKIILTYNEKPYTAIYNVGVLKGPKDGESPVIRRIYPIPPQLIFKDLEEEIAQNLKIKIQETIGRKVRYLTVRESGLTVRYSFKQMPQTADEDEPNVFTWTQEDDENGIEVTYSRGENFYAKAFDSKGDEVHSDIIAILRDGRDGENGESSLGRFYYYAGDWGSIEEGDLTINEHTAPYVQYAYDGEIKYYMCMSLNDAQGAVYAGNPRENPYWEEMERLDYLISKAIFSDFAKLGAFVINGNWMISQDGTINGDTSEGGYLLFDPAHPNEDYVNPETQAHNFIPNYAVDGKTGTIYLNKAVIRGTVYADNGRFSGEINATSGKVGGFNINDAHFFSDAYYPNTDDRIIRLSTNGNWRLGSLTGDENGNLHGSNATFDSNCIFNGSINVGGNQLNTNGSGSLGNGGIYWNNLGSEITIVTLNTRSITQHSLPSFTVDVNNRRMSDDARTSTIYGNFEGNVELPGNPMTGAYYTLINASSKVYEVWSPTGVDPMNPEWYRPINRVGQKIQYIESGEVITLVVENATWYIVSRYY